jgi:hypothetical protein
MLANQALKICLFIKRFYTDIREYLYWLWVKNKTAPRDIYCGILNFYLSAIRNNKSPACQRLRE